MDIFLFLIFLAGCMAAAATGAIFKPDTWYESLNKPAWTPPNWVFPVVWTTLYLFMAYAAMRVAPLEGSAYAMGFYVLQLVLNTLWSPVFFGQRRMGAALVIIVCLWVAVVATTVAFFRLDWIAGLLFVPYIVWVTTAGALNRSVMNLNPDAMARA